MTRLGCSGSLGGIEREGVAFEHNNMLEIVGERPRRRQAGHAGTDHDRLPTDQCGSHGCPSSPCRR